ncbi:hypothetical protein PJL18_02686 [Paenarthrobacter nicotinovorans]|nr:hypothetical protein [Paenarthrobacter nicotinovorans]
MALLVGGQHTVVQDHVHHGNVLDVDHFRQILLLRRRPVVQGEPVPHAFAGVVGTVGDITVDSQISDGGNPLGVATGEPVDDVDVVGALLKQEGRDVGALGVPVLEVVVPAVADEVAAPDRFDVPDPAILDELAHLYYHRHVAHVVADIQACAGFESRAEDQVRGLNRDVERLFAEGGDARLERPDRDGGVLTIGGQDQYGVQAAGQQFIEVGSDAGCGNALGSIGPAAFTEVADDGDLGAVAGFVGVLPGPCPLLRAGHR